LPVALKSLGHVISYRSGISTIVATRQRCIRILMYHGITAEQLPVLRSQLSYLRRCFSLVSLDSIVDRMSNPAARARQPINEVVLTFDDGLRNNLSVVYPVLKELGIPATFFVCPGLIGTGWLWNHEVRCRLELLSRERFDQLLRSLDVHGSSVEDVVEWMKGLGPSQRSQAEETIRAAVPEFSPTARQAEAYDIMDWDDLLSFDPRLITIGSHTMTHPILTTLDGPQIEFELRESRRHLEEKLARPVCYFCYPNGSHDARVLKAAKAIYSAAVTTESGLISLDHDHDPHLLPRIPSAETLALLAWRMHRPGA
jgi:peptidoglycan/xylan/chitin deacetylase (PgdA/CDA1 family)